MGLEVALALMLVIGAGLLATSLTRLYTTGLGFEPKGIVNVNFEMDKQSLDGDTLERFMDTLAHELLHTGVIHIGGGQARNPLFTRTLHLTKAPPSHTVGRDDAAAVVPPIPNPASRPGP